MDHEMARQTIMELIRWRARLRMTLVHVICLIVCYYRIKIHSQSRIVDRSLTLEKDRVRNKIMNIVATSEGRKIIRIES